jgi:3-phosphoshikimate 1-carboxyvinyltransferase
VGPTFPLVRLHALPSKSVTHRALVAAALARGVSRLLNPLDADDTRATRAGVQAMGVPVQGAGGAWVVQGCGGRPPGGATVDARASGTTLRFLAAMA